MSHPARRAALAFAVLGLAVAPATARASTAGVEDHAGHGPTLTVVQGDLLELNEIDIAYGGGAYIIADAAGITPTAGCTARDATSVSCDAGSGPGSVRGLYVDTGDGDDHVRVGAGVVDLDGVWLDGGDGDDALTAGSTDDVLAGGSGDDVLDGGAGEDLFISYDRVADGGTAEPDRDGADTIDGGAGHYDAIAYGEILPYNAVPEPHAREAGVTVVLRGAIPTTGNGEPGENDELVNIEDADGGSGADTLDGGDADNLLSGGEGGDTLIGGDGQDVLDGDEGADTFGAGPGDDLVSLREEPDAWGDELDAGADCGPGVDRIATGPLDVQAAISGCEEVAPRITAGPTITPAGSHSAGVTLTASAATIGTPQPTLQVTWSSCATEYTDCVARAVGPSYLVPAADVGRIVRAEVAAINGDVPALGFFARASRPTLGVGPFHPAPPPPYVAPPPRVAPPPSVIGPPLVTAATASTRLLGGPVRFLVNVGPLSIHTRTGASAVRVRPGRTAKVFAMVCLEATCEVTIGRELRLRPRARGGARTATKAIKLPGRRLSMRRTDAGILTLRLTTSQRRSARRAAGATLRVTVRVRSATGRSHRTTQDFRLRSG